MIKNLLLILKNYIPNLFIENINDYSDDQCYIFLEILNTYLKVDSITLINKNARFIKYNKKLWENIEVNIKIIKTLNFAQLIKLYTAFNNDFEKMKDFFEILFKFNNSKFSFIFLIFMYVNHKNDFLFKVDMEIFHSFNINIKHGIFTFANNSDDNIIMKELFTNHKYTGLMDLLTLNSINIIFYNIFQNSKKITINYINYNTIKIVLNVKDYDNYLNSIFDDPIGTLNILLSFSKDLAEVTMFYESESKQYFIFDNIKNSKYKENYQTILKEDPLFSIIDNIYKKFTSTEKINLFEN